MKKAFCPPPRALPGLGLLTFNVLRDTIRTLQFLAVELQLFLPLEITGPQSSACPFILSVLRDLVASNMAVTIGR